MIHKAATYGEIEDVTVVEFGNNTLSIATAIQSDKSHAAILIREIPMNSVPKDCKDSNEFTPEVVLILKNLAGLESLQECINDLRLLLTEATK